MARDIARTLGAVHEGVLSGARVPHLFDDGAHLRGHVLGPRQADAVLGRRLAQTLLDGMRA